MSLNIKNLEVEKLATQIVASTGETKTEAIRKALLERRERLGLKSSELMLSEMESGLREIQGERCFSPVTKDDWDRVHE